MSTATVATGKGRVSITALPDLAGIQPSDQILAVQDGAVGLVHAGDLPHSTPPDLSGYATTTALTEEAEAREQGDTALSERIDALAKTSSGAAALPVGTVSFYAGPNPPENWLIRDGSPFSISRYPSLAKLYPNGILPDDRGLFIRGYDPTGQNDLDGGTRGFASYQEGSYIMGEWSGNFGSFNHVQDGHSSRVAGIQSLHWDVAADQTASLAASQNAGFANSAVTSISQSSNEVIGVTRPKNRNYLPIIYAGTPVNG